MDDEPRAVPRGRLAPGPAAAAPGAAVRGSQARTAFISVIAAAVLVAIKLVTGILTGSLGLLAEAAHSATDLIAALLTLFAVRVAVRPPDRDHPFGHGKAQHLAALGEGIILVAASVLIGFESLRRLLDAGESEVRAPWYAFAVLGVVLVIDASRSVVSWRPRSASAARRSPPAPCTSRRTCSARSPCSSGWPSWPRARRRRTRSPRWWWPCWSSGRASSSCG
jgi:hypothetical protein